MSRRFGIVEELAANYVSGRLPAVLKELVDKSLDDFDKVIVRLLTVGDCIKRCYDGLGPNDWKRGDLGYPLQQLVRAKGYLDLAIDALGERQKSADNEGKEELPL